MLTDIKQISECTIFIIEIKSNTSVTKGNPLTLANKQIKSEEKIDATMLHGNISTVDNRDYQKTS